MGTRDDKPLDFVVDIYIYIKLLLLMLIITMILLILMLLNGCMTYSWCFNNKDIPINIQHWSPRWSPLQVTSSRRCTTVWWMPSSRIRS